MNKLIKLISNFLKFSFLFWEIVFFSFGPVTPIYAQEASESATAVIDKIKEASESAISIVSKDQAEQEVPQSLPLPFNSAESKVKVTSWFGEEREVSTDHLGDKHNGIDFDLKLGEEILAVDDGEVLISGYSDYGLTVTILHPWGKTVYGHLKEIANVKDEDAKLQKGDKVTKGQVLGLAGSSGNSTGTHLHFGIKKDASGNIDGFIDPAAFFNLKPKLADPLLEATAAASLEAQILGDSAVKFEDLRGKAGYLYNYKFSLSEKTSIHFDHRKINEPGFAVVDEDDDYKLRFFLKESSVLSSQLSAGSSEIDSSPAAQNDNETLTVKENDLGFLRVRSEASTLSEELIKINIGDEFRVLEEKDGWYKIEYQTGKFGWVKGSFVETEKGTSTPLSSKSTVEKQEAKVGDNNVEFPVVVSGIPMTLRYTVSNNQVKEEFVIDQKPAEEILNKLGDNLSIRFDVENEKLKTEDLGKGSYKFSLDDNEYWQLQTPTIEDAKLQKGEITGELKDNVYSLTLNTNYLSQASYPVTIDPTVVINTSSTSAATQASTQNHMVTTSDGTLHNFVQIGTQSATCNAVSRSGLLWFYSTDSGATWTCGDQLSSDTTNLYNADVRADASSNIYVVYSATSTTGPTTTKDVLYRKLTKGVGATWTVGSAQTVLDGDATTGYGYATLELEGTTRMWIAASVFTAVAATLNITTAYSDGLTDAPTWTTSQAALATTTTSLIGIPAIVRFGSKIGVLYTYQSGQRSKWRFRSDGDGLTSWVAESAGCGTGYDNIIGKYPTIGDSAGHIFTAVPASGGSTICAYNGQVWNNLGSIAGTTSSSISIDLETDGSNLWVIYGDSTGLNSGLSGSSKLSYKKCWAPYTANDCDATSTPIVSSHRVFNKYWSFVGGAYTDDTTDAASTTATDTQMVTSSGDIAYFGLSEQFDSLSWDLTTAGNSGGAITWEYCSAVDVDTACTTWSSLSFTSQTSAGASEFEADGYGAFTTPGNWVTAKVNSEATAYYYVRARATASYSTSPVGAQMAAIPLIGWATSTMKSDGTIFVSWAENAITPFRIRSASFSVTPEAAPASTADISPSVLGNSAVTTATQNSTQRHLVKTSDGTLHAFIQSSSAAVTNQLACGSSSSSNNNTGLMWITSTDSGSTWTCGGQISSDTANLMYADARVDSSDNIYIVYSQLSGVGTSKDVFYRKLTKGIGSTWTVESAQTILDASSGIGYHYATLELEGTTRIWISARYLDGTNYQIPVYYSDGLSASPTWTQSIANLDTAGTSSAGHVSAMVRFGSKIGVIYANNAQEMKWRFRSDSDPLTTWTVEAALPVTNMNQGPLYSVVGDQNGNIYGLFGANSASLGFSYFNGQTWSALNTVTTTYANTGGTGVSLTTDGAGTVWAFYGDTNGLNSGLSGSRKLVYKKGIAPYTASDFDATATSVASYQNTFDKAWTFISSAYTDETTDIGSTTASDVAMPSAVGDIIYLGKTAKFDALSYDLTTFGTVGQVVWEYYNGSAWKPLANYSAVSNTTFGGDGYLSFTPHTDWATTAVNGEGISYYYLRARVITAYSVTPVGSQMAAIPQILYVNAPATTTGTINPIWTENAANPTRVRAGSVSVTTATTPSATAEISPAVVGYSSTTTATQVSTQRHLVKTSDGTLHAFIQSAAASTSQQLACGSSTSSSNNTGLMWLYSTDSGSTWTCGGQISSTTDLMYADTRADSSDNIYVVYSTATTTGGTTKDVFYRKLTKGSGASWTIEAAQTVLDGTSTVGYHYATLELEGTTRIWLSSRYYDGTNYQVTVYYSDGLSAVPSWTQSITNLETAGTQSAAHYPTMVRFGSKIGVIYLSNSSVPSWRYRADSDGLTSWVTEGTVTASGLGTATFSAIGDTNGNVYYVQNSTAIIFNYWNGSSWSSNLNVSSVAPSGAFVSVSLDNAATPNIYVLYGQTTGLNSGLSGSRELVYKKGVSPYGAANFDTNATDVVSYHGTFDKVWRFISSSYTDETTDAGSTTASDVGMPAGVGDIIYFGKTAKFDSISVDLSTSGTVGQVVWEYYNGSTWMPIVDYAAASNPTFAADGYLSFTPHTDWATTAVNGEGTSYYYIRARAIVAYSVTPVGAQMAAIPQINWASLATNTQGMLGIWTENAANATKVRYATIQSFNATPSAPSSLGPTAYVNGSFGVDSTPDLTFSVSDSDVADTLKYQIQIDDTADFSSPITDYTSALAAQGARTFTVGQAAGSGTYAVGSEGQTLADGSYYWRVRAIDNGGTAGSYSTANSGAIAFKVDVTAPTAPTSVTSSDHTASTWSTDPTVTMTWTAATDATAGIAGYYYVFDTNSGTVPTASDSSTASTTVTSSSLTTGSYYFHIRAYDNAGNLTASGSTVHAGPYFIDVSAPTAPGTPTTNNPTADLTPTWSWTASTDSASGLAGTPYSLQWSTESGFGSITGSTTSATNSFTHSTELSEGVWYFRVKATDNVGNETSWVTGSVTIDTTSPSSVTLISPGNGSFTNNPRPVFQWQAAATSDSGVGLASYTFHINNGSQGDIDIPGIPISGTSNIETSRYVITYQNFSDSDPSNNYISIYTKTSTDWSSSTNDGKLAEGVRSWYVTAIDNAGNSDTASWTLYADFLGPVISNIRVENIANIDNYLLVTTLKPKISGNILDNLAYSQLELSFAKENYFLGIFTGTTITKVINHNFNNTDNLTNLDFSFLTDQEIDYGKYQLTITGIDKAGNRSDSQTIKINVLTYEKAKELIALRDKSKLDELKSQASNSIADLEKQALLRREKEAAELDKLFAQIRKDFAFIFDGAAKIASAVGDFINTHFKEAPIFIADLWNSFIDLASLAQNSATALVMAVFEQTNQYLADIGSAIGTVFSEYGAAGVKQLAVWRDFIGDKSNELASATYQMAVSAFSRSPESIKWLATAILVTPFEDLNKAFSGFGQKLNQPFSKELAKTHEGLNSSLAALVYANNSITDFADSLGNPRGEYSQTSEYLAGSLNDSFAAGRSFVNSVGSAINSGSSTLAALFDNSNEKLKGTLGNQYTDASKIMSDQLNRGYLAVGSVYQSAMKPLGKGADFFQRVKVGAVTFYAIVFDDQPTRIANVTIEEIGKDYAVVSWETNHPANGKVNYGKDLTYGKEVMLDARETYHRAVLTDLEPGKRFFFEVMSEGKNYTYDAFYSFETPAEPGE